MAEMQGDQFPMTTWVNSNLDGIEETLDTTTKEVNTMMDKLDGLIDILNDPLGKAKEAAMAEAKVLCNQIKDKIKATTEKATESATEVDTNATAQKAQIDATYQALTAIPTSLPSDPGQLASALVTALQNITKVLGIDKIATQKADAEVANTVKTAKMASIGQKTIALGQKVVIVASKAAKIGISI